MTGEEPTHEPISTLDARVDDLLRALGETPNLDGWLDGLDEGNHLLEAMTTDNTATVEVLALSNVWQALTAVGREVSKLRQKRRD